MAHTVDSINKRLQQTSVVGRYTFTPITEVTHGNQTRINLTCNVCGHKWSAIFNSLSSAGSKCPMCRHTRKVDASYYKLTKSLELRGLSVITSRGDFNGLNYYIDVRCKDAGHTWRVNANNVLRLNLRCPYCSGHAPLPDSRVVSSLDDDSKIRGYSYSLIHGINSTQTIVQCICGKCGCQWHSTYSRLVSRGQGCPFCGRRRRTLKQAIDELLPIAQSVGYEFNIRCFKNNSTLVDCKCSKCGYEWSAPYHRLKIQMSGCPRCTHLLRRTPLDIVVQRLSDMASGRYIFEYPHHYKNDKTMIKCRCSKCGNVWESRYSNLVFLGYSCPNRCYTTLFRVSQPEHEILDYIKQNFPHLEIQQSVRSLIKNPHTNAPLELDIYIPEIKLAIEFNGTYWHSDESVRKRYKGYFTSAQDYHNYKTQQCALKGIKLIHIAEQDYRDNKQKVLDTLRFKVLLSRFLKTG